MTSPSFLSWLLTIIITLGGYPLCFAVQLESAHYSYKSLLFFPHCILLFFSALLSFLIMVFMVPCLTAFEYAPDVLSVLKGREGWGLRAPLPVCAMLSASTMSTMYSLLWTLVPSYQHLSISLLLLEHAVLQLFPSFGCLFLFGTFYVCFTGPLLSQQLLATMPHVPPVDPIPAIPVPAVNSVEAAVFELDKMVVGDYPSPEFFTESLATALYHMVPNHAQLLAHAVGVYNALMGCAFVTIPDPLDFEHYMRLTCAYQASDLFDYFQIICEDHPDAPYIQDFVDLAQTWLAGCKLQYSTLLLELRTNALSPPMVPPWPSMPSPMVQEAALPVPAAPKPSYADKAATPHSTQVLSTVLPPCITSMPPVSPNKPQLWATIKGTHNMCIYSHIVMITLLILF